MALTLKALASAPARTQPIALRAAGLVQRQSQTPFRTGRSSLKAKQQLPAGRLLRSLTSAIAAPAAPTQPAASLAPNQWNTVFRVHDDTDMDLKTVVPLEITIKDRDSGELSDTIDISGWQVEMWDRPRDRPGLYVKGQLRLGQVETPGAAIIKYIGPEEPGEAAKQLTRVYVSDLTLTCEDRQVIITANSWVNKLHGERIFFQGAALLPAQTPDALKALRQSELYTIQGKDSAGKLLRDTQGRLLINQPRRPADRIESYATYNDLGSPKDRRPVLGDPTIDGYCYPRRVATNRGLNKDNVTEVAPKGETWIPADNDFDAQKQEDFGSSLKTAAIPLVAEQLQQAAKKLLPAAKIFGWAQALVGFVLSLLGFVTNVLDTVPSGKYGGMWRSFKEVTSIYDNTHMDSDIIDNAKMGQEGTVDKDEEVRCALRELSTTSRNLLLRRADIEPADFEDDKQIVDTKKWKKLRAIVNDRLEWPEPYSYCGHHELPKTEDGKHQMQASDGENPRPRHDAWTTDKEFGRQCLAGQNPLTITALTELPENSAFTAAVLDEMLEGNSFEQLMADAKAGGKPRLLLVDYEEPYASYAAKINSTHKNRFQYAGRCVLYFREDGFLVPVGIELHSPESVDRTVYTRRNSPREVWQLAKAVFGSLDSGVHQLVSHWLRTHANVEPYIIATDRCLSSLHPVFKFLQPHLQYTLRINADARSVLIAAKKIIELSFTPGDQAMQLSAEMYKDWQFKDEALPADLAKRGLATLGADGDIHLLLEEYPYGDDGVLIWNALEKYARGIVEVYYEDDAAVTSDTELAAWWHEIRTVGHADAKPEGWPELNGKDSLTRILATIAWVPSAHHAAVNFGQADYSGLPLNRSSLIRKPIPQRDSSDWQALTNPDTFEEEYLQYISNTLPATIVVAVLEILSAHAENEHYLSDAQQDYFTDPAALAVHSELLKDLSAAEQEILDRNLNTGSKMRHQDNDGLPYQLLLPSSPTPGVTGRGIPYSISI